MGKINSKFSNRRKDGNESKYQPYPPPRPDPIPPPTTPVVPPNPVKPIVIALHSFTPRGPTELRFVKGDKLEILSQNGMDWWRGRHMATKDEGYIPVSYVASITSLDAQDWYFGKIAREEAENLLLSSINSNGSFLVRASETDSSNHGYTLSVRVFHNTRPNHEIVKHYRILTSTEGYFYIARSEIFMTLNDLVDAYLNNDDSLGLSRSIKAPCKRALPIIYNLTPDNQWEISMNDIEFSRKLGAGSFGEVWLGIWNNQVEVAIKSLVGETMSRKQFLEEATIMKGLRHKNILTLYGVCSTQDPLLIITEHMCNGSLIEYLKHEQLQLIAYKIYVAAQVADGMKYLEEQQLIHRDLAARNVLVGESLICKIADFGLARLMKGDEYDITSDLKFPVKWTAPEAYLKNRFSIKSDVWSFGVLLYEIFTDGGTPYPELSKREVMQRVENGYRMNKPPNCPEQIYEIMYSCWNISFRSRPTFEHIFDRLHNFITYEERSYE